MRYVPRPKSGLDAIPAKAIKSRSRNARSTVRRPTPDLRRVLAEPFSTAWLFDVEILARLIGESSEGTAAVARYLYELPLDEWRDIPGSKLTRAAYARAATSIFKLYRRYGAMLARQSRASRAVDAQLPA